MILRCFFFISSRGRHTSWPRDWSSDVGSSDLAGIDQELDPYDPERVHGYRLSRASCERLVARLAELPLAERRELAGLHPDRAPTIVAGAGILLESMRVFDLDEIEVSENDILHGAALASAR